LATFFIPLYGKFYKISPFIVRVTHQSQKGSITTSYNNETKATLTITSVTIVQHR